MQIDSRKLHLFEHNISAVAKAGVIFQTTNMFSSGIVEYFGSFWKTEKPPVSKKFVHVANDVFKIALSGASWFLYVTAVILVASCLYYYYFERIDRWKNRESIKDIQQIIERPPPKRRPGAVGRKRKIFQNVMQKTHSFIYPDNQRKSYMIRATRSGTVYGKFLDDGS